MTTFTTPEAEVAAAADTARWWDPTDAAQVLTDAQDAVRRRREAELSELLACARWADVHGGDPRDEPGYRAMPGGEKLVQLGGEGTPMVRDLTLVEMGIALSKHPLGVRAMTADVLDLRHRLPRTWAHVMDGDAEVWLARRVATLSRAVPAEAMWKVDAAVAGAITGVAPSRLLRIAEAAVIVADPHGHRARTAEAKAKRYVSLGRHEDTGLRTFIARVTTGDAIYLDAMVDRVADILTVRRTAAGLPDLSHDTLRSEAMGWLARPAELMALLITHGVDPDDQPETGAAPTATATGGSDPDWAEPVAPDDADVPHEPDTDTTVPTDVPDPDPLEDEPVEPTDVTDDPEPGPEHEVASPLALRADVLDTLTPDVLKQLRPAATIYLHLHESALAPVVTPHGELTHHGVARIDGHGPLNVAFLQDLLGNRPVVVKPVIDTREHHAVDAYEHPAWMREHITLTKPADQFPHATQVGGNLDLDHPVPWDPHGPPGQTSTDSQPLTRTAHRAKTHLGYTVEPTDAGTVWTTPHGLTRLVDHHGRTHRITSDDAQVLVHGHTALDAALDRIRAAQPS